MTSAELEDFVTRYRAHLLKLARERGVRAEDAEDLLQNVLMDLWVKRDTIRDLPKYARRAMKHAIGHLIAGHKQPFTANARLLPSGLMDDWDEYGRGVPTYEDES